MRFSIDWIATAAGALASPKRSRTSNRSEPEIDRRGRIGVSERCRGRGRCGAARERELRSAGDLAAPDLVDVETVAVLRKRWLDRDLSAKRFAAATTELELI